MVDGAGKFLGVVSRSDLIR
ncbi:MAG: hypothetical protein ACKO9A_06785, partial [Alphaproteobacteria bacterium]